MGMYGAHLYWKPLVTPLIMFSTLRANRADRGDSFLDPNHFSTRSFFFDTLLDVHRQMAEVLDQPVRRGPIPTVTTRECTLTAYALRHRHRLISS
uniref:Putative secreted protein n=1 Tax=Anopheles aquasalis TaxID=42839 RepID=T1E8D4_ANOAQ